MFGWIQTTKECFRTKTEILYLNFFSFYWLKFTYFIGIILGIYVALSPTFFELYQGLSNFLNGFLGHGQTKVEMAGWGITWRV